MPRTLVTLLILPMLPVLPVRVAVAGGALETHLVAVAEPSPTERPTVHPPVELAEAANPTHCAKKAELVGANCSFSTGLMAQRVLDQGRPYTYTGPLVGTSRELGSRVAVPYVIGPHGEVHVVANEVVEALVGSTDSPDRVTLMGRVLEVDGIRYFVATRFETSPR